MWARHRVLQAVTETEAVGADKTTTSCSCTDARLSNRSQIRTRRACGEPPQKFQILHEQVLDLYWQFPYAHSGRVVNRISDRGGDAGQPDLAYATCAYFIELFIWIVEEVNFGLR